MTLAVPPVVESEKVLLLNAASSNPVIACKAGVGGFRWTFRNYPTDEVRSAVVLKYATEKRGCKKSAVLSVDSDYGRGAIAFTKKYLDRYGATILQRGLLQGPCETDCRPVLAKIRREGDRVWPAR